MLHADLYGSFSATPVCYAAKRPEEELKSRVEQGVGSPVDTCRFFSSSQLGSYAITQSALRQHTQSSLEAAAYDWWAVSCSNTEVCVRQANAAAGIGTPYYL